MNDSTTVTCIASDPDGDSLSYLWKVEEDSFRAFANSIIFYAPKHEKVSHIHCIVRDVHQAADSSSVYITTYIPNFSFNFNYIFITDIPIFNNSDSSIYAWAGDYGTISDIDTNIVTSKLESLFLSLIDSSIYLKQAWYQHPDIRCGSLDYPPPPKLLLELIYRNDSIVRQSFVPLRSESFFDNCSNLLFRKYNFLNLN